jgi:glycerol uptake facilitator-like aquaporin
MLEESTLTAVVIDKKSVLTKAHFSQILFFEIGGMFLFTYGVSCCHSLALLDLQISLSVIISVCFSGFLCGANFNPCISLMCLIRRDNKITWKMFLVLLSGQIIGTFMGGSLGYALNGIK